jgi:hypothetical protein
MNQSIISELRLAFGARFGRHVSDEAIKVACGLIEVISDKAEVDFLNNVFEYLKIKSESAAAAAVQNEADRKEAIGVNGPPSEECSSSSSPYMPPECEEVETVVDDSGDEVEDVVAEEKIKYVFMSPEWCSKTFGDSNNGGKPNATLTSHLKGFCLLDEGKGGTSDGSGGHYYYDISQWDGWINAHPNSYESRRVRLGYIIKWAADGYTKNLDIEDKRMAEKMLADLVASYKNGEVESIGVKTADKKKEEQDIINDWFMNQPLRPPRSAFEIFGKYIPVRRGMDTSFFFVFDTMADYNCFNLGDGMPINAFVKDVQKFFFGRFKNVATMGPQEFACEEVRSFCPSTSHFEEGINWMMKQPNGFRFTKVINPTSQFRHWNAGLCNNSFRHHLETVVAKKLGKSAVLKLHRWLCHSPTTALMYYRD